ncbi:patatin-like phospholipase family protein [Polluticoccus soli]|uniref:patatin-like phospholipase family protein n=1 Tax=Polluticoccus soli TaxID=3034150 RepID=UPI0023E0ABB1|nr:patatin-like phospholipase family protein [Flavipsychrobacter sp. JY13-12]
MQDQRKIGLSLSGGGYRASAFHLGTLNKLDEMGILDKVDVMSTISGGSITGAAWCLHEGDYKSFHAEMKKKLETKNVISFVFRSKVFIGTAALIIAFLSAAVALSFTSYAPALFLVLGALVFILMRHQYRIYPVSKVIEKAYDKFFFNGKTLSQLCKDKPVIAIGSSNLETGRPFTFSQRKMADSGYSTKPQYETPVRFKNENFPVARAVMASSCVPFAFSPIQIDQCYFENPEDAKRARPVLVDGGVYDNQGIQKLTQDKSSYECDIIITSDAGGKFFADKKYPNTIALLIRTVDLFMYRIKASQMQTNLYHNIQNGARPISYFSLGWSLDRCISGFVSNMVEGTILPEVINLHGFQQAWIDSPDKYRNEITDHLKQRVGYTAIYARNLNEKDTAIASSVATNLTSLSTDQTRCLITHAENLAELQVKLYCPMLVKTGAQQPTATAEFA